MVTPLERYQKLMIGEALSKFDRYPLASQELSSIIKLGYDRFPKNLQTLIFQDTLTAFRLLPDMQTSSAVSAAHRLLKSVGSAFPKQKRNLAVSELKHAKVALKRRSKTRDKDIAFPNLPQDLLLHIFSFLDVVSLVSAAQVCRSWNLAAVDNNLWKTQYSLFEDYDSNLISQTDVNWREMVKNKYIAENLSRALKSPLVYCCYCASFCWHNNLRCPNKHCRLNLSMQPLDPISSRQVVDFVLGELMMNSSSESESDDESFDESLDSIWRFCQY